MSQMIADRGPVRGHIVPPGTTFCLYLVTHLLLGLG